MKGLRLFQQVGLMSFVLLPLAFAWAAEKMTFSVSGMSCGSCAQSIEREMKKLPAVQEVHVDFSQKRLEVTVKEGQTLTVAKVSSVVSDLGYSVRKLETEKE